MRAGRLTEKTAQPGAATASATVWQRLRTAFATRVLLALLFMLPVVVAQAQDYTCVTNNGTITITKYTGPGGDVTIPDTMDGLPVTSIDAGAFRDRSSLTGVTVPDSVTLIGWHAFYHCTSLTGITIGNSVTSIMEGAFARGISLTGVYFKGNAPSSAQVVFAEVSNVTVYYLSGTTGWGPTFAGRPTVLWNPQLSIPRLEAEGRGLRIE